MASSVELVVSNDADPNGVDISSIAELGLKEKGEGLRNRKLSDRLEDKTNPRPALKRELSLTGKFSDDLITDPHTRKLSMRAVWFACFVDVCCRKSSLALLTSFAVTYANADALITPSCSSVSSNSDDPCSELQFHVYP